MVNIFKWENFPVLLSSTRDDKIDDIFYDFDINFDNETGLVFQKNIPPQDIVYKYARNSGIGLVWKNHYDNFFDFISSNMELNSKSICEIGSGNGYLAKKISEVTKIICYEPNPSFQESENIEIRREFFSKSEKYDVIICSHTLEHISNIGEFMKMINESLEDGGYFIVSVPNFEAGIKDELINIFTSEHISYFTEDSICNIFTKYGMPIIKTEKYINHSIFTLSKKNDTIYLNEPIDFYYLVDMIHEYIEKLANKISDVKNKLDVETPLYLFGCHAMTSIFLYLSKIDTNIFYGILDNDPLKTGTRLYGYDLNTYHPNNALSGTVILNGSTYHEEIKDGLLKKGFTVIEWN